MKKHRTETVEIILGNGPRNHFIGPRAKLRLVRDLLAEMDFEPAGKSVSWRDAVNEDIEKFGEAGLALRGARHKEGLTQVELAKRVGIGQANLSAMESGTRPIGKKMAKKLAAILKIDYRVFL